MTVEIFKIEGHWWYERDLGHLDPDAAEETMRVDVPDESMVANDSIGERWREMKCKYCNCDQEHACPGGCFWILPEVCSQCAVVKLTEAKLNPMPVIAVQQALRDRAAKTLPEGMYISTTVPFLLLAGVVNCVTGWVALLKSVPLHVRPEDEAFVRRLSSDTKRTLENYDYLAAKGYAPSRNEICAMYESAGNQEAPVPAPPVIRFTGGN